MLGPSRRQLLRMLEREREAHAIERSRLIDQLCNLAGHPWTLPPRPEPTPNPDEGRYLYSPEQLPDV